MGFLNSGLFKHFFGKPSKKDTHMIQKYFTLLSGYTPSHTSYQGALYEIDLVRACVNRIASECAKTTAVLVNDDDKIKNFIISQYPNDTMTAYQFYYRLATIYQMENNAYIVPVYAEKDKSGGIIGLIPIQPHFTEVIEDEEGDMCYRFTFNDEIKVFKSWEVGHIKRMQYKNDLFGDSNDAFANTADLLVAQEKSSASTIKSNSILRFMAKLNTPIDDDEDYERQQKMFMKNNLENNESGVLLYDPRFEDVKPIESKPLMIDADQKKAIENSVYTYWGINEDILQNKYSEDTWNAFYESAIEPFFIQVQEVISKLLFSREELMAGKAVKLTSDRLGYASNKTKISVATQFVDRGMVTINQALDILNMPPLPDDEGNLRVIRSEYINAKDVDNTLAGKEVKGDGKNGYSSNKDDDIPNEPGHGTEKNRE